LLQRGPLGKQASSYLFGEGKNEKKDEKGKYLFQNMNICSITTQRSEDLMNKVANVLFTAFWQLKYMVIQRVNFKQYIFRPG
jgi:hypothetical protein